MEDDDERHRREEQERRAKRKASKGSKSQAQLEKERKLKEHREKILKQHAGAAASQQASASSRATTELTKSVFQELFSQRAQGFQIDFRFRNAPPRPPVGPTFVGHSLDSILLEQCQRYKPLNAVEVQHKWRLHSEVDVGVPLAPSAMDLKSYVVDSTNTQVLPRLHPDDADLLDWSGPMGDTAADRLKSEQERKRIKDRQMLSGKRSALAAAAQRASANDAHAAVAASGRGGAGAAAGQKKLFSRVLNEGMQTWMKKTTYLSNDYSRKVHDFKSLAQTKQDVAQDLQMKQEEMMKRRSATAVSKGFAPLDLGSLKHPVRPGLKPVAAYELFPSVPHWGSSVTHVVMDKPPPSSSAEAAQLLLNRIGRSFVGNVERNPAKARMSCQLFVPATDSDMADTDTAIPTSEDEAIRYDAVGAYDLEVLPLKEEDSPHTNFVLIVDREKGVITYLPVSSRVQLSRGRPVRAPGGYCLVSKRPLTDDEVTEREERAAEVDAELSEKHGIPLGGGGGARYLSQSRKRAKTTPGSGDDHGGAKDASRNASKSNGKDDGDGEDDFGDDDDDESSDSEDETMFGSAAKTIVAEG